MKSVFVLVCLCLCVTTASADWQEDAQMAYIDVSVYRSDIIVARDDALSLQTTLGRDSVGLAWRLEALITDYEAGDLIGIVSEQQYDTLLAIMTREEGRLSEASDLLGDAALYLNAANIILKPEGTFWRYYDGREYEVAYWEAMNAREPLTTTDMVYVTPAVGKLEAAGMDQLDANELLTEYGY